MGKGVHHAARSKSLNTGLVRSAITRCKTFFLLSRVRVAFSSPLASGYLSKPCAANAQKKKLRHTHTRTQRVLGDPAPRRPYRRDAMADALDEVSGLPFHLPFHQLERPGVVHGVVKVVGHSSRSHARAHGDVHHKLLP